MTSKDNFSLPIGEDKMDPQATTPSVSESDLDQTTYSDDSRRESGVFLSPQTSHDPTLLMMSTPATRPESGYVTGDSVSSVSQVDPGTSPHGFYISEHLPHEDQPQATGGSDPCFFDCPDPLFDSGCGAHLDIIQSDEGEDEDELELSGVSVDTLRDSPRWMPVSRPMDIPGAGAFSDLHSASWRRMEATPPRSYITHSIAPQPPVDTLTQAQDHSLPHSTSTGCLTLSPIITSVLLDHADSQTGRLLERGFRVTSGLLHASSQRAERHRMRTCSESQSPVVTPTGEDPESFSNRDRRSQSVPNFSTPSILVQRQCAQELRKISDEFFEEFPRKGKAKTSMTHSKSCVFPAVSQRVIARRPTLGPSHPGQSSSFPGTRRDVPNPWWWQAIIQSLAPSRPQGQQPPPPNHQQTHKDPN